MFKANIISIEKYWKSKNITKNINLWNNLDLFISASGNNEAFLNYLLNKILDYTIGRISINNTYKDFSQSLELINSILKAGYSENKDEKINMTIWVLNDKELLFSNIWKSSCYLVKKSNVIEITDKRDLKKEFSFISNWKLEDKDIIIMSSKRLLNFLSESDFIDSYNTKIGNFNSSIKEILSEEKIEKNISILSIIYKKKRKENKKILIFKNTLLKIWDTNFSKRIYALYLICYDKFFKKEKMIKNILFFISITIILILLFKIIWNTVQNNNESETNKIQEIKLEEAKVTLRIASQSISNKDIYELNIKKTREIIKDLEKEDLFIEDIKLLKEKIIKLNKSFVWIETFIESDINRIIKIENQNAVKIVELNKKIHIIWKNYIIWPIIKWITPKKHIFNDLKNDAFIDATNLTNKIALVTEKWKIVLFSKNGSFKFSDVIWQEKWRQSNTINSFNSNIYLLSKKENQIFKHKRSGNNFTKGFPYLKKQDKNTIKEIVDIAIDWWFYILKKDLWIIKFFANPIYRVENLILNWFPANYKIETDDYALKIKTRKELIYVYILLNDKIFIAEPNSRKQQNTKSLKYLWQIEWQENKIIDFYIKHDWELNILTKTWIYRILFEKNDWKIIIR